MGNDMEIAPNCLIYPSHLVKGRRGNLNSGRELGYENTPILDGLGNPQFEWGGRQRLVLHNVNGGRHRGRW